MRIETTPEASEVLRRSMELGNVDPATGGIRLRGSRALGGGFEVQIELADGAAEGDVVIEQRDLRLFVDPNVADALPDALLVLDPQHDTVTVRART